MVDRLRIALEIAGELNSYALIMIGLTILRNRPE